MRRPRAAALLSLPVALLLAAGCTKPPPEVTIQGGGTSLRSEPLRYNLDGKTVENREGPKVLAVRSGDTVNISVDKKTADAGWLVLLNDKITRIDRGQHHYAFPAPDFANAPETSLVIFEQPPAGGDAAGSWIFTLRQEI
jgi:hypothetical protein